MDKTSADHHSNKFKGHLTKLRKIAADVDKEIEKEKPVGLATILDGMDRKVKAAQDDVKIFNYAKKRTAMKEED